MPFAFGFLAIVLILEAVRRVAGWALMWIALACILYAKFAWLLPGVTLDAARDEAEAFRLIVGERAVVTASLGVASKAAQAPVTPSSLVAAADAALYQSKAAGRDRVTIAPSVTIDRRLMLPE